MTTTRRQALFAGLGAAVTPALADAATHGGPAATAKTAKGLDGQRRADLGNGTYLNPILAGDHPDPSVLKDGDIYYQVSSSFTYYPGLVVWRSRDLVNWLPVGPALTQPVGSVYAPDLIKHDGRYYIYFPARTVPQETASKFIMTIYVVHADNIRGPWSDPVDVGIHDAIDPGHVVGEDGKRYLFLSSGALVELSDDGLAVVGKEAKAYDGWPYPSDWEVETFALEGPKLLRKDGWYYMFSAEGGTAGPPTSHMVIAARSKSVHGPWENCPHNPIVHTRSIDEPWWSRGHGTPVQGPAGDWWMIYHGYENGRRTLGRQMLLEPIEWTSDGWPVAKGGDLSKPLRKPVPRSSAPHGISLSGPFASQDIGARFTLFKPGPDYRDRLTFTEGTLVLRAQGKDPTDASPIVFNSGDRNYDLSIEIEVQGGALGGLLLYYNEKYFCGLGFDARNLHKYQLGTELTFPSAGRSPGGRLFLRVRNRDNVASFFYSADGQAWALNSSFEVAGYNHNVAGGYLSLRPAILAARDGAIVLRTLTYAALD